MTLNHSSSLSSGSLMSACPKSMLTGERLPVLQNDIPDVHVIVQDAVLGLDSTESLHDVAGDPLCFLLGDVNTRAELRHSDARDIFENESLNDVGDRMKVVESGSM